MYFCMSVTDGCLYPCCCSSMIVSSYFTIITLFNISLTNSYWACQVRSLTHPTLLLLLLLLCPCCCSLSYPLSQQHGLWLIAVTSDHRFIQMITTIASNEKGEPWQTVDLSYGFAIFNDKDKEKFMPTRLNVTLVVPGTYVLICMYAHPSGPRSHMYRYWYYR